MWIWLLFGMIDTKDTLREIPKKFSLDRLVSPSQSTLSSVPTASYASPVTSLSVSCLADTYLQPPSHQSTRFSAHDSGAVLQKMYELYADPSRSEFRWRSPGQSAAVHAIVRGEGSKLISLPCGSGKTAISLAAASLVGGIVVVTPYITTKEAMMEAFAIHQISVTEWNGISTPTSASAVLVMPSRLKSEAFKTWLVAGHRAGGLKRLVIEEAQAFHTDVRFREDVRDIAYLGRVGIGIYLLTGTHPSYLSSYFRRTFGIGTMGEILEDCVMPKHRFNVICPPNNPTSVHPNSEDWKVSFIRTLTALDSGKTIVFTSSRWQAQAWATKLDGLVCATIKQMFT